MTDKMNKDDKRVFESFARGLPFVRDAAISRRCDVISIALVVGYAVAAPGAKNLGDNAVRFAKTILEPERGPRKLIGEGCLTYLVGVHGASGQTLAVGVKASDSDSIRWQGWLRLWLTGLGLRIA